VAGGVAALIQQIERRIDEADSPEETKEEVRSWLSRAGGAALSSAAGELLVRILWSLH
jgi:hypothetical protein